MRRASWVALIAILIGCENSPSPAGEQAHDHPPSAQRIACLSPALSSTLCELGWKDRIVGRTPWCEGLEGVPVVGSLLEVNLENLSAVHPDLILVQRSSAGLPPALAAAAASRHWCVAQISCTSLRDVQALEPTLISMVGEVPPHAVAQSRWSAALAPCAAAAARSPCMLLFAADPPQAFGSNSYLAQVWKAWGGSTLPDVAGDPTLRLEDVFLASPRSVLLIGGGEGAEVLSKACADRGVAFELISDGGLLRPGPQLLASVERWRASCTGDVP